MQAAKVMKNYQIPIGILNFFHDIVFGGWEDMMKNAIFRLFSHPICFFRIFWRFLRPPILIHQPHRIVGAIRVRRHVRVLVGHRIHAEPDGECGVVVPGSEIGVSGLLVTLLAGEGVAALVARGPLVGQLLAPRQVVQVLDALARLVAHPAGTAQVVGVVPVAGGRAVCKMANTVHY